MPARGLCHAAAHRAGDAGLGDCDSGGDGRGGIACGLCGADQLAGVRGFGAVGGTLDVGARREFAFDFLTAFIVNLRFVVFSGTTKPFSRVLPLRFRLLYGFDR